MDTKEFTNLSLEELRKGMQGKMIHSPTFTPISKSYADAIKRSQLQREGNNQAIIAQPLDYAKARATVWKYFLLDALDGQKERFKESEKFNQNVPELIRYFIGEESIFDANKGILLVGPCGTGKTQIMSAISNMFSEFGHRGFKTIYCPDLCDVEVIQKGLSARDICFQKEIFFDDIGAEFNRVYNQFGNKVNIIGSIIAERYRRFKRFGQKTHASTNLSQQQMEQFYTVRVYDRMKEMFNFISLGEKSLRS